jgi:hypothetical protein
MAVPDVAPTGRFLGPFQFIHSNDTSSYAVGNASTGDSFFGNSSASPISGVIHAITVTTPNTSSTAAYTLTVDGTSSAIVVSGFVAGTFLLDIGFNRCFVFSNSSTAGHGVLSFLMANI